MLAATVGPSDLMYLPAGWICYEKVGPQDFIGARKPHLAGADLDIMEKLNRHLITADAPSPQLQAALDCLITAEAE